MGILDPDSGNKSKRLYSYVKSLKKDSYSVSPLRDKQGNLQSSAATQATLLNNQFASVFTSEDTTALPKLSPRPNPDMNLITIHTNGVAKMLRHIKAHKATGPDNTCMPAERSCRPANSNANNNLSGIIQPRHRPYCLAPSRCCSRGPNGTFKLPPYIPHGHLLQIDVEHIMWNTLCSPT